MFVPFSGLSLCFVVIILVCADNIRAGDSATSSEGDEIIDQSQTASPVTDQSLDTSITNGESESNDKLVNTDLLKDQIIEKEGKTMQKESFDSDDQKDRKDLGNVEVVETLIKEELEGSDEKKNYGNERNDESNNQSFFSIGNILKSIVDPVLEEFEKGVPPSGKQNNESVAAESIAGEQVNETDSNSTSLMNQTLEALISANKTDKKVRFHCNGKNLTETNGTVVNSTVKIVNNTGLLNLLNFEKNDSISDCVLVLFFAPWCPFCAKMAPNYNALARVFPQLEVLAVDAAHFSK